jgi:hypothetical protein
MKKIFIAALLVGVLSGCYTQLLTDQTMPQNPPVQKISYIVDTVTNDTIKVLHQVDTVLARDNRNCYWTRNMWGQPELRCDGAYYSNYSSSWNMYNNSPWWYERDMYGNYYNNYYGFGNYYHSNHYNPYYYGNGNSSETPSVSPSGSRSLRRTSSSAMSRDPVTNNTYLPQSKNVRAEGPPSPQPAVQNTAPAAPPENRPVNTNDNNNRRKPSRSW